MATPTNERAIGQLEGKVDALLIELKDLGRRAIEAEERAAESRARVYERLEKLGQDAAVRETRETLRFDHIEKRIDSVERAQAAAKDVAEVQAKKIDGWETRFVTVVGVISVLGTFFGSMLVIFKERVIAYLFGT